MGNTIVRPITDDGLVGYDQCGQLVLYKHERGHTVSTFVADVREMTCAICNRGWQPSAVSMDDQLFWSLLNGYVHETCLVRHFGLIDRAEFHGAICAARIRFRGLSVIPNEYWPPAYRDAQRPWFRAELIDHAASIVIGSRKRVIELRVVAEGPVGFDWIEGAKNDFAGEDVTKDFSERTVLLHAWSTNKLRDYIKRIATVSGFDRDLERERERASKAEARGDVSQGPRSPLTAVRDAHETPARQEAASSAVGVPGNAGAQAGDRSQSSAIGSASPSNALGKSGASAEPGASRPAAAPADQPAALAPDELCDIDDLPDCLVGGVHQPHCRHAGKPVTKGGNP